MVRTCEARSASADSLVGRSLSLRAACRQAWLRERSALLCRLLDMSFFITASMSATSQGGALEIAYMPIRMMCSARHVTLPVIIGSDKVCLISYKCYMQAVVAGRYMVMMAVLMLSNVKHCKALLLVHMCSSLTPVTSGLQRCPCDMSGITLYDCACVCTAKHVLYQIR